MDAREGIEHTADGSDKEMTDRPNMNSMPSDGKDAKGRPRNLKIEKSYLNEWISRRIHEKHQNVKIAIYGPPGSGKSYAGLSIGLTSDPNFWIDNIRWSVPEFGRMVLSESAANGSAYMGDDLGLDMTPEEWESKGARFLSFLFQGSRNMQNGKDVTKNHIYIITVPGKRYLIKRIRFLFDLTVEMDRHTQGKGKVFIPFESPLDDDRIWRETLRDKRGRKIDYIEFSMPPRELIEIYEHKRSANNMDKMLKTLNLAEKERAAKEMKEENEYLAEQLKAQRLAAQHEAMERRMKILKLYGEGYSQRQISKEVGINHGAISKILSITSGDVASEKVVTEK